jgi:hypothetical protein
VSALETAQKKKKRGLMGTGREAAESPLPRHASRRTERFLYLGVLLGFVVGVGVPVRSPLL